MQPFGTAQSIEARGVDKVEVYAASKNAVIAIATTPAMNN